MRIDNLAKNVILYKKVDNTTRRLLLTNICKYVILRTGIQLNNCLPRRCFNIPRRDDRFRRSIVMDTLQQHDHNSKPNLKKCSKCPNSYPATDKFFNKKKTGKGGLNAQCKECTRAKKKENYQENRDEINEKRREHYQENRDEINEDRREHYQENREDLNTKRREHRSEHRDEANKKQKEYRKKQSDEQREAKSKGEKAYREEHHDTLNEYGKKYYSDHKEELNEKGRIYREEHQDEIREWRRTYNEEHREEKATRDKEYRQTPQGRMVRRAAHHRRRARKKGSGGSYTAAQIQAQLKRQKYRCYYAGCGHAKFEKKNGKHIFHIDHIVPLSRGGTNTIDNIVLSCPTCNMHKHNKLPHEWSTGGRLL